LPRAWLNVIILRVTLASGVVVAQGTLAPLTQVRILARQPVFSNKNLLSYKFIRHYRLGYFEANYYSKQIV
jgi:hypothetical protein